MIFVTVGTTINDFGRLIKEIDRLAFTGKVKDKIIVQTGYTKYIPKYCDSFKLTTPEKMEYLCKRANIYITHGGVGSLTIPLKYNKPIVAVPRLKKFNEHVDDHQIQIVKELEKQGRIIAVYDIKKLDNAIKKVRKWKIKKQKKTKNILQIIENFIEKNSR